MKVTIGMAPSEQSPNKEANGPAEPAGYEKHEIHSAANTLMEAEQIKKKPKLMVHVKKHLDEKMGAIRSVQALRQKYKDVSTETPNASGEASEAGDSDD